MRSLSGDERTVLAQPDYQIYARLAVENQSLQALLGSATNPLRSFTVVADVDQPVQTLTATLDLGLGAQSLSPYLSTGAQISNVPVFGEDRAVSVDVRCVLAGTPPSDVVGWRTVFRGALDTADVDTTAGTVTISARDRMGALQSTEIENITPNVDAVNQWGLPITGGLLQDMIQQILNDSWTYAYGVAYPEPFVVVGTAPTDTATAYWQQRVNLLEAIRAIGVGKNGWDLRGRWDLPSQGLDTFVLAYYLPDRPGGSTPTPINASHDGINLRYMRISSLSFDVVNVKNVAEVTPADAARVPVITSDAASILRFGRRFLAVSEDAASHIDTPAEAAALGDIIVSDLRTGKADIGLELPFAWLFEVNDLFTVGSDGRTFDRTDLVFGITHTELRYELGAGSLAIQGRLVGAASQLLAWRKGGAQARPKKVYVSLSPPVGPAVEGALWIPVTSLSLP